MPISFVDITLLSFDCQIVGVSIPFWHLFIGLYANSNVHIH